MITFAAESSSLRKDSTPCLPNLPPGICCPSCRGPVAPQQGNFACSLCQQQITAIAENLLDLTGKVPKEVEIIQSWSDDFMEIVKHALLALGSGQQIPADVFTQLEANQLVTSQGQPTHFGKRLMAYFLTEQHQRGDELQDFIEGAHFGPSSRVLDLGCSIGALLRSLARVSAALETVGVDNDAVAVAWGARVARKEKQGITFCLGNEYPLPFRNDWFSHVICRNAITYMHQRRALEAMCRALKPGGYLCLRFYTPRYNWRQLYLYGFRLRQWHELPGTAWSLFFGFVNELVGWQPTWKGRAMGSAFGSVRRIAKTLKQLGCEVIRTERSRGCSRFWGVSTGTSLFAQKRP